MAFCRKHQKFDIIKSKQTAIIFLKAALCIIHKTNWKLNTFLIGTASGVCLHCVISFDFQVDMKSREFFILFLTFCEMKIAKKEEWNMMFLCWRLHATSSWARRRKEKNKHTGENMWNRSCFSVAKEFHDFYVIASCNIGNIDRLTWEFFEMIQCMRL